MNRKQPQNASYKNFAFSNNVEISGPSKTFIFSVLNTYFSLLLLGLFAILY